MPFHCCDFTVKRMFNDQRRVQCPFCFDRFGFSVSRFNGLADRHFWKRNAWRVIFSALDGWNSGIESETHHMRKRCFLHPIIFSAVIKEIILSYRKCGILGRTLITFNRINQRATCHGLNEFPLIFSSCGACPHLVNDLIVPFHMLCVSCGLMGMSAHCPVND